MRSLYTPEPVRGRVITRHMSGESNRQIATAEGIDRETVGRILSQQEVVQLIAQYQARILSLVPKAIAAFEEVLDSDNLHLKAATAAKLLEGIGALHKGGAEHIVENASTTPEQQRRQQRLLVLGSMTEMMLLKSKRYGTSLPPELEGLKDELNRCFETPHPGSAAE